MPLIEVAATRTSAFPPDLFHPGKYLILAGDCLLLSLSFSPFLLSPSPLFFFFFFLFSFQERSGRVVLPYTWTVLLLQRNELKMRALEISVIPGTSNGDDSGSR